MNGDINGTMTEPMEIDLPCSPASKDNGTPLENDGDINCDTNIQIDTCKTTDSDIKKCPSGNGLHEDIDKEIEKKIDNKSELNGPSDKTSEPDEAHNETITNNCIESNSDNIKEENPDTQKIVHDTDIQAIKKEDIDCGEDNAQIEDKVQTSVNEDCREDFSTSVEGSTKFCEHKAEETLSIKSEPSCMEDFSTSVESSAKSCEHKPEETLNIKSESGSECELSSEVNQSDDKINDLIFSEVNQCDDKINDLIFTEVNQSDDKINDVIVLDEDNKGDSSSPEIQEIISDNENAEKTKVDLPQDKVQLRRSSRTIKRKRYNDEVENGEASEDDELGPFPYKMKPIVINNTKALVAMAAKQMKNYHGSNHKKEPTVVIIDTNSSLSGKIQPQPVKNLIPPSTVSINAQNLYQSIVARGTTVTPISNKTTITPVPQVHNTPTLQNSTPPILPSLTDDMFVVEAPSFIVPYVYEKPSLEPFREFVDKLGKELEEQKLKEEEEKREKQKQECKEEKEKSELKDVIYSKTEENKDNDLTKKKKSKKEQKRRQNDEDDDSWDGASASESDDEVLSDEDDKIVVKDKVEPLDQINTITELTADKIVANKTNGMNPMDCSLGKFFINIGLNLVQEYVQSDLLKQQNRKLYREKKGGHSTQSTESSIAQLRKNLEFSKENNAPYAFAQNKCEFCSFKTESKLVMAQHLETPHMKNNIYKCNFCTFEIRSPHDILYHMEVEHNIRGKLERAPSYHQCANCPFEDNGKGKLARHLIACAKKFKPDTNLAPPVDWEPPAKIPKIAKPRNSIMSPYQNTFNRAHLGTTIRGPINVGPIGSTITPYRPRGRTPMSLAPRNPPVQGIPIIRAPSMMRHNAPSAAPMPNSYQIANHNKPKSMHQPSISITPLPRQPQPIQQPQPNVPSNKSTFVICEICDGYIKDLEQLRNHMQWIHKVKIHPKMIYNRPPLNCQKCQFRFFTDQGLERHLLGSHGLVTSSMQEAANKGKDAGRCPVCGRVYQWKLLNHVARDHNLTLKPAHLSYKCTVCTATFGMYKQFENHVYSAHSVVAKKVIDKSKISLPSTKSNSETLLKPLKINDEITIIPQPIKPIIPTSTKDK